MFFGGIVRFSPRHLILIFRYWFPLKERRGSETTVNIVLKREIRVKKQRKGEKQKKQ